MENFFSNVGDWFLQNWQIIVKTLAIVIVGVILIKIILAIIKRQFNKTKMEKTVQTFILSVLKFLLWLILIFAVISSLGISITGLTVVLSAVSLAVSLALQDSLKNLVNGFVIITTKLVKAGDWVKIGDAEGTVKDVKMLYTILQTADNKRITIPNSSIIGSEITNYNVNKSRRIDLTFDISYNSDVDLAKQTILDVVDSCAAVFDDPKPSCVLSSLNESSITLTLKIWCLSSDYWDTKWYLIDNIFNELKRNNITIPFNQLEVALVDPNKKSYVREQKLTKVETHKKKVEEEDDIISSFNKSIRHATELEKIKKEKKKQQKLLKKQEKENKSKNKVKPLDINSKEQTTNTDLSLNEEEKED